MFHCRYVICMLILCQPYRDQLVITFVYIVVARGDSYICHRYSIRVRTRSQIQCGVVLKVVLDHIWMFGCVYFNFGDRLRHPHPMVKKNCSKSQFCVFSTQILPKISPYFHGRMAEIADFSGMGVRVPQTLLKIGLNMSKPFLMVVYNFLTHAAKD